MSLSRRSFLKKAAAGLVVATAAPLVSLPSAVIAAPEPIKKFYPLDKTMIPPPRNVWTVGGEPITGPGYHSGFDNYTAVNARFPESMTYHDPAIDQTGRLRTVNIRNPDHLTLDITYNHPHLWIEYPPLFHDYGTIHLEADGVEYVGDACTVQYETFHTEQTDIIAFKGVVNQIRFNPIDGPITQKYINHIIQASAEMSQGPMIRAFRIPKRRSLSHYFHGI
jgi:hypothetical protein